MTSLVSNDSAINLGQMRERDRDREQEVIFPFNNLRLHYLITTNRIFQPSAPFQPLFHETRSCAFFQH